MQFDYSNLSAKSNTAVTLGRVVSLTLLAISAAWSQQGPESILDQGIEHFHKGEYSEARDSFEKAVKLSPADARAITFLGVTSAQLGHCARWEDELQLQAGRNPDLELRKLAGLTAIQCLLPQNRFTDILPMLTRLEQAFPGDADVIYEAAKVYSKASNYSTFELFQRQPSSWRVNQLSAEAFEGQGKFAEAAAEYQKAIEKNPTALILHYRCGRALLLQGRDPALVDKARVEFEAELKLNPDDVAAEYQVGQTLLAEQKNEQAAEHFEKAVASAPRFAEALIALGKIRLADKEHAKAITLLQRAVQAQPSMEAAHYNLMVAFQAAGKAKDAQKEKKELDRLKRPAEGEFAEFLKKLNDKPGATAKP